MVHYVKNPDQEISRDNRNRSALELSLPLIASLTMAGSVSRSLYSKTPINRKHLEEKPQHPTTKRAKAKAARKQNKRRRMK